MSLCLDDRFPSLGIKPYGVIALAQNFAGKDSSEECSVTVDVGAMALFEIRVAAPLVYYNVKEEAATLLRVGQVRITTPGPSSGFSVDPLARYTVLVSIPRSLMTSLLYDWSSTYHTDKACYTATTLRFWMRDMTTVRASSWCGVLVGSRSSGL